MNVFILFIVFVFLFGLYLLIFGLISPKTFLKFMPSKYQNRAKSSLLGCFIMIVSSILAASVPESMTNEPILNEPVDSLASVPKSEEKSPWIYEHNIDKMTDDTIFYATSRSNNYEEFDFPYSGGSTVNLILRKKKNKNEVIFRVINGQIMSSYNSSDYVRIRFDNSQPESFYYNSADDGSADCAFINQSNALLKKIKESKLLAVEIPFFQEGRRVFYFSVEKLVWK